MKPKTKTIFSNQDRDKIYLEELSLNLKYQGIKPTEILTMGYEVEQGRYVFMLVIPKNMLRMKRRKRKER